MKKVLIGIITFPIFVIFTILVFLPLKAFEPEMMTFRRWFVWWHVTLIEEMGK